VHVIREGSLVKKLWRGSAVIKGDAYEAGLYTLRPSMFGVLEKLEVHALYIYRICSHIYVYAYACFKYTPVCTDVPLCIYFVSPVYL
jgi:hypothetical protein